MLVAPPAAALLVTQRLLPLLIVASIFGALSAVFGHVLALTLPGLLNMPETTTSGMIAVCTGLIFLVVWITFLINKRRGTQELEEPLS